jgi:hypothetical protein
MAHEVEAINQMFRQVAKQIVRDCYLFLRREKGMTALQAWRQMQTWRTEPNLPPCPTYY